MRETLTAATALVLACLMTNCGSYDHHETRHGVKVLVELGADGSLIDWEGLGMVLDAVVAEQGRERPQLPALETLRSAHLVYRPTCVHPDGECRAGLYWHSANEICVALGDYGWCRLAVVAHEYLHHYKNRAHEPDYCHASPENSRRVQAGELECTRELLDPEWLNSSAVSLGNRICEGGESHAG